MRASSDRLRELPTSCGRRSRLLGSTTCNR